MKNLHAFTEQVSMKYQIYNGLFLNLPFPDVRSSGIILPVFTRFIQNGLESGRSPLELVEEFFSKRVGAEDFRAMKDDLFRFLRLAERQVVLFDALEDAAFTSIVDISGPGSVKDILNRIESTELQQVYQDFIATYRVRVVLTAHPTQFYTDQVLGILGDLVDGLDSNNINAINDLLLQMGQTRFKKQQKPSPLDEAQSLMWTLEKVMFNVVPRIHALLSGDICPDKDVAISLPGILQLGFWPGGDRDGNPFVTADITRDVGDMLRNSVISLYLKEIKTLTRRLTFDGVMEKIQHIEERLEITLNPVQRILNRQKPYRDDQHTAVYHVEVDESGYNDAGELIEDMMEVRSIIMRDHRGLFAELIEDFIYRVQCFGFHFASLDIRQDSGVHSELTSRLFRTFSGTLDVKPEYDSLSENEKLKALTHAANVMSVKSLKERKRIFEEIMSSLTDEIQRDCLQSFRAIAEIQNRNGEIGAHRYIISHSEHASHVLEVWFFAILCGFDPEMMTLDIVPLFETIDDLHNAPGIMKALFDIPEYAGHLAFREKEQHIMLGFSDGTKDGGYVTANWEIYRAKETLTAVCSENNVRALFFDGRGGPPARGGGNTHKFYRSLGKNIDSKSIQLTLQGQTISSSYGTEDLADHNLGQIVSAGLENNLFPSDGAELQHDERQLIEKLSTLANAKYMELRNHNKFLKYLEHMTPLKYYGRTNIGSRPSKRKGQLSLDSLRAIPFVGAWSQMKQNVPGYFGLGSALREMCDAGSKSELQALYKGSLFFRTLMENSMQSLSKSYFPLTAYLAEDPEFGDFWNILKTEAEVTESMLLEISGQSELLSGDQVTRQSIELRETMILPVMAIQQYALQKLRQLKDLDMYNEPLYVSEDRDKQIEALDKLIIKSLMASINASRNSV